MQLIEGGVVAGGGRCAFFQVWIALSLAVERRMSPPVLLGIIEHQDQNSSP